MKVSVLFLSLLVAVATCMVSAQDYNPDDSKTILDIAGATYCHADQLASWSCAFCKEQPDFVMKGTYENTTTNMQIIVGYHPKINSVILAFKGTSPTSITNWLQDLTYAFLDEECPGCAVHKGFYETYLSVKSQAVSLVHDAMDANPSASFTITGHSLGGALANIAAIDLTLHEQLEADAIYTYGQPRVGNPAFAQFYQSTLGSKISWRVTHGLDPVPHVPTEAMGYLHHNTEVYYNELNTNFKTCSDVEDPTCADGNLLPLNPVDHGTYLGGDFLKQFLACQLYTQEHHVKNQFAAVAEGQQVKSVLDNVNLHMQQFPGANFAFEAQQHILASKPNNTPAAPKIATE